MDEAAAREVMLVRAVEAADAERAVWRDDDRAWASAAAAAVVGAGAPAATFLARRAALALERLGPRHPALGRALRATAWRPWIGTVAVALAFLLGLAADQIGPAKRVNILAFPMLAIVVWNLAVYLAILLRGAAGLVNARARSLGPIARALARLAHAVGPRPAGAGNDPISSALARFLRDWSETSAGLAAARVGTVLHVAAIAFALGAVAGLYLRGLVLEYRAAWESTFLGAETVHRVLAFVLAPASAVTRIPVPDAEAIAALGGGPGVNAAPWLHLYAATIALFVMLPRGLLALGTWLAARRLERRFPLALDDAYFQRLARQVSDEPARVAVVPYGRELAAQAALALQSIVRRALGPHAEVSIGRGVEWGGEDALPADLVPAGTLAAAMPLFNLSSTFEAENHGAFVAALRARVGAGTPVVALVDETSFRRRFAQQAARLEERRAAWREALAAAGVDALFLDLAEADLAAAESALLAAIERAGAGGRRA
jgi:hypothetical protein